MTEPKNAAREVASRLAEHKIRIKHVQALDLVAAGCGYQDRSKLAALSELPRLKAVNAHLLSSVATTIARHDLDRRNTVVSVTTDVLMQDAHAAIDKSESGTENVTGEAGASDETTLPTFDEWIARLEELADLLPKDAAGHPIFAYTTSSITEWDSEFARYVRLQAQSDDATTMITAIVDASMRVIEGEDGHQLGFDPDEDEVAEGESPIDYDRIAASLEAVIRRPKPMGPLELALRDGAGRASAYSASFSDDPGTATGGVAKWIRSVDEAFRFGAIPSDTRMRELLGEGNSSIWEISHMLPSDDRLRAWLDVSAYPNVLGNEIDQESSGIPGVRIEVEGHETLFVEETHLRDPSRFLGTPKGKRLVSHLISLGSHEAWTRENRPMEDATKNSIASSALELLRKAKTPEDRRAVAMKAISAHVRPNHAEDDWYQNVSKDADQIVEDLAEGALQGGMEFDREEWEQCLRDAYVDTAHARDDSRPQDVVHHTDKVEVMFFLHSPDHGIDDMCTIRGPWPDPKAVILDDEFVFAASRLGITPAEWVEATGSEDPLPDGEAGPDPLERLMTAAELAVCVENGCTQNFCIVVYAIVPLHELLELDLTRPFAIGNASIAVYNQYAGTFHEKSLKRDVVLMEGVDGSLQTTDVGYSPKDICGMAEDYYAGHIYEPEIAARRSAATAALDAALAIEGLRRNLPGTKVHWNPIDGDELMLEASFGTENPSRRYALRHAIAQFESVKSTRPEIVIKPN